MGATRGLRLCSWCPLFSAKVVLDWLGFMPLRKPLPRESCLIMTGEGEGVRNLTTDSL